MSVVDDLRTLEARVTKRLEELRPMVDEYQELEQIAARLGLPTNGSAARERPARPARRAGSRQRAATTKRPRRSAAPRGGGRRDEVLASVKQQPGITVREIGAQLGVDPTALYRAVRALEREKAIVKDGRRLRPA